MIIKNTFHTISLGCAKNTVDTESMSLMLQHAGLKRLEQPEQAQFIIVNTCGFIQSARDESYHVLKQFAADKKKKQYLIAAGCLTERFKDDVTKQQKGIDGIFGTRHWMDVISVVEKVRSLSNTDLSYQHFPVQPASLEQIAGVPSVAIQGASAYLKIADGCRHRCAFCAIPLIKGEQQSLPIEKIVSDARYLRDNGVQEINLIAQDTTGYGLDLGMSDGLSTLLENLMISVPDVPWIRILYGFPGGVSARLIDILSGSKQVLPYIDIPLQHADIGMLRAMHRPANMDWVYNTIQTLRERIAHIALRTTFIVGYPGETEKQFQTLLDFVREIRFDHMGAFAYSFEKGTPAEPLGDPISEAEKNARLDELMTLQEEISETRNKQLIGSEIQVLIEGSGDGISVGRSYRDAPEIDGLVFADSELEVGKIISLKVTNGLVHDLLASFPSNEDV